jgi:hypothetical protein
MSEIDNVPQRRKPGPKPLEAPAFAQHGHVNARTLNTADLPLGQNPDIVMDDKWERGESIVAVDTPLVDEYTQALAMAEEPVTIMIEPSQEENAPIVVDCWVNGKGAEVWDPLSNKWMELGCLPIGGAITTKRKYVEVLARAKIEGIRTAHDDMNVADPQNRVVRNLSRKAVFSVIHDANPKSREWLTRLIADRS